MNGQFSENRCHFRGSRKPPNLRGRPVLLQRYPNGAGGPSFFQKRVPELRPEWLQTASLAVPTRWAVDALDAMTWRAQPFSEALLPSAVMLGFAVAFGLLAIWRFRWEE